MTYTKKKIVRWLAWVIGCLLLLALVGEMFLRWHYGLCDAVLMRNDPDYEYIAQPNQRRHRFGNEIVYNSLSMRSGEIRSGAIKILCVGDSVVNGGTLTEQKALATTLLEERLSKKYGHDIQVLNISAGSWGPDNCAAYLKRHGVLGARAMILVCSSHDARDNMNFVPVVGIHPSYPDRQYPLAYMELLDRYYSPGCLSGKRQRKTFEERHHISKDGDCFNPGFEELAEIARDNGMFFGVVLHAELAEAQDERYNAQGQEILSFLKSNHIPFVMDIQSMTMENYRKDDVIHLSVAGQRVLTDMLERLFDENIEWKR